MAPPHFMVNVAVNHASARSRRSGPATISRRTKLAAASSPQHATRAVEEPFDIVIIDQ